MDCDHSLLGGTAFATTIRGQKFRNLGHKTMFYKHFFLEKLEDAHASGSQFEPTDYLTQSSRDLEGLGYDLDLLELLVVIGNVTIGLAIYEYTVSRRWSV